MRHSKEKNYDLIMDTALALFREKGYSNVSVTDICNKAKIQRCTFYSIFSKKDDIITSIFENMPDDDETSLSAFITAENDLERIWLLFDKYVNLSLKLGSDLVSQIFKIGLENHNIPFANVNKFRDWFCQLIKRCQDNGIIRNMNNPEVLVTLGIRLFLALLLEWCLESGRFPLKEASHAMYEDYYDIAPQYRAYT